PALPAARISICHPGAHGRRDGEDFPRFPRTAQRCTRTGQGRHPVPPAGDDRYGTRALHVDEVEMRRGGYSARGAKGGVICDPHNLSAREQEQICRGWVRQVAREVGPVTDVPAPDVMTDAQHMLWMLDEFEKIHGGRFPGFITGKPVGMGGSLGRTEATGYGVVFTLREALKE